LTDARAHKRYSSRCPDVVVTGAVIAVRAHLRAAAPLSGSTSPKLSSRWTAGASRLALTVRMRMSAGVSLGCAVAGATTPLTFRCGHREGNAAMAAQVQGESSNACRLRINSQESMRKACATAPAL
jgi:hypothetical protein